MLGFASHWLEGPLWVLNKSQGEGCFLYRLLSRMGV